MVSPPIQQLLPSNPGSLGMTGILGDQCKRDTKTYGPPHMCQLRAALVLCLQSHASSLAPFCGSWNEWIERNLSSWLIPYTKHRSVLWSV